MQKQTVEMLLRIIDGDGDPDPEMKEALRILLSTSAVKGQDKKSLLIGAKEAQELIGYAESTFWRHVNAAHAGHLPELVPTYELGDPRWDRLALEQMVKRLHKEALAKAKVVRVNK